MEFVEIEKIAEVSNGPVVLKVETFHQDTNEFCNSFTLAVCRCGKTRNENGYSCDGSHKQKGEK